MTTWSTTHRSRFGRRLISLLTIVAIFSMLCGPMIASAHGASLPVPQVAADDTSGAIAIGIESEASFAAFQGTSFSTITGINRLVGSNPSVYGTVVTFRAFVVPSPSGVGTVTFKSGSTILCNAVALSLNVATCTPHLAVGAYSITAEYSGAPGFTASTSAPLSQTVIRKTITGGFTVANKLHDGTTAATITGRSLSGVVGSDDVSLTGGTATFADANVGAGKTVTGSGFGLGGAAAGNYTLGSVNTTTADIFPASVTLSLSNLTHTYDGSPKAAIVTTSPLGLSGVTVTYDGSTTAPTDAGSYSVVAALDNQFFSATGTLVISPATVDGSFTADNKVYDGTTAASILTRSLPGTVVGDDVALTGGIAAFDTEDVGAGKTVTGEGFALSGADAGNYSLASSTLSTTADITEKMVTGSFTAADKVWDGNTDATILTRSLADVVDSDDVSLAGGVAAFENADVGTGKIVTGTGFSLAGTDAANYVLASSSLTTTASILQKWTTSGFLQPVEMTGDVNVVKAGSTVPLKFAVLLDEVAICDASVVKGLSVVQTSLPGPIPSDTIADVATGGTVLRCENGQFLYNWSTKGLTVGKTYTLTITLEDGTTIFAYFKMK